MQTSFETFLIQSSYSDSEKNLVRAPRRSITFQFPFERDSGEIELVTGYRVQHNDILGPTKGGLRFHPSVTKEEIEGLALLMTLKTSLADLPYGGAKGGLVIDPGVLSRDELERISRAYIRELAPFVGPHRDILAPDVNTTPEIMSWMRDEYENIIGEKAPAVVTGKPVENGGSEGRVEATGRGGFHIIEKIAPDPDKTTVAFQGFGNVARHAAQTLTERGYRVVAVSDSRAGLFDENGLDIPALMEFKKSGGRFSDYTDAQHIENQQLLELDVTILSPAALGHVITKENASQIHARTIVELANAPTSPEADVILEQNSVMVIPDILANAGGVIASYFEWKQNLDGEHWSLETVRKELKSYIEESFKHVQEIKEERSLSYRDAAYTIAVDRILGI